MNNTMKITGIPVNAAVHSPDRSLLSLDGNWACRVDPENRGMAEGWAASSLEKQFMLAVPGCIQSLDELASAYPPADGLRNKYLGTFWLEREFFIPDAGDEKKYWLKFGGIAPAAHIWINGSYVGFHHHTPVSVKLDVTAEVRVKAANRVTLAIVEQSAGLMGGLRGSGFEWSGLYRAVELEITSAIHIEEPAAIMDENYADITGKIYNDTKTECRVTPEISILEWPDGKDAGIYGQEQAIAVGAGQVKQFQLRIDVSALKKWSCENPSLYRVSINAYVGKAVKDSCVLRLGFRTFTSEGRQICLNGQPFMIRGVGHEYFSPTISPVIDSALLKSRFQAIKEHGFNFCRYHTYMPTDEELDMADELGILLSSEISLVSNFHKTTPFEEGLRVLEQHIVQTRNHPSLGIYCLGNEGSQLMVDSIREQEHAKAGYDAIKAHAPKHPAMIAFGMQGELPELPNDMESPHLWSHNFLWAYKGLGDIPWRPLSATMGNKPCVIHEYGKFGVWPDAQEERLYPDNGYQADFGMHGREALREIGLEHLEQKIIANSRKLSLLCNRMIIEEARRQNIVNGYVVWTFFRKGICNAGFIDDMGRKPDNDPAIYREGCNSPVAVLIDRGFSGHVLQGGSQCRIGVHLSNYGRDSLHNWTIRWKLDVDNPASPAGRIVPVEIMQGQNGKACDIQIQVPAVHKPVRAGLKVEAECRGEILACNQWDFWVFPNVDRKYDGGIVVDFCDRHLETAFQRRFPGTTGIADLDSMIRGCRSWKGTGLSETLQVFRPRLLVADHPGEAVRICLERGIDVLMLDSGNFPEEWYTTPFFPELGEKDPTMFYTSFRSGWDQGIMGTVVEPHELLEDFPQEGFGDLQCYSMLQGARSVKIREIEKGVAALETKVVIRAIAKVRVKQTEEAVVQDPNARKALEKKGGRKIAAQDQVYLADIRTQGGRFVISTLKHFDDPAGEFIAENMLKRFREEGE